MPVLNLVISGIPSILKLIRFVKTGKKIRFKPCYKWNTFNTELEEQTSIDDYSSFKPCYKWNTFNT